VAAAVLATVVFTGEGIDAYYRSRLVDMVHGDAYRPYVSRALVPGVARLGTAAVPAAARAGLADAGRTWRGGPSTWDPDHATEYAMVVLVMGASLIGFATALARLVEIALRADAAVATTAAVGSLAALPVFFGPFSRQIYDFTTLWLF